MFGLRDLWLTRFCSRCWFGLRFEFTDGRDQLSVHGVLRDHLEDGLSSSLEHSDLRITCHHNRSSIRAPASGSIHFTRMFCDRFLLRCRSRLTNYSSLCIAKLLEGSPIGKQHLELGEEDDVACSCRCTCQRKPLAQS